MTIPRRTVLTLPLLGLALPAVPSITRAQDARTIASVDALLGSARVFRHGQGAPQPLAIANPIFEGDRVATGPEGRLRLRFVDRSVVVLGAASTLTVEWFLDAPDTATRNVLLDLAEGVFSFVVERLLPRASFEVGARTAVASVRGTTWMAEVTSDAAAFVTLEGQVDVAAAGVSVVLMPGEGTTVEDGQPPSPPSLWGAERIAGLQAATTLP